MPVAPQSYNSIIPQAADLLNQSQPQLLNNFGALASWIDQNHVDSQVAGNQPGKHTFVQMPVQAGTPTGGFLAGEDTLYSATSAMSGKSEISFVRGTGVAIGGIPQSYEMTTYGTGSVSSGGVNYDYVWTRFPSGILQLWGTQTNVGPIIGPAGNTISFPAVNTANTTNPFPGFAATYNVQITLQWNNGNGNSSDQPLVLVQGSLTTTQFVFTRAQVNNYTTRGSVSFSVVGI